MARAIVQAVANWNRPDVLREISTGPAAGRCAASRSRRCPRSNCLPSVAGDDAVTPGARARVARLPRAPACAWGCSRCRATSSGTRGAARARREPVRVSLPEHLRRARRADRCRAASRAPCCACSKPPGCARASSASCASGRCSARAPGSSCWRARPTGCPRPTFGVIDIDAARNAYGPPGALVHASAWTWRRSAARMTGRVHPRAAHHAGRPRASRWSRRVCDGERGGRAPGPRGRARVPSRADGRPPPAPLVPARRWPGSALPRGARRRA